MIEYLDGYLKALEIINSAQNTGTDYFIEEISKDTIIKNKPIAEIRKEIKEKLLDEYGISIDNKEKYESHHEVIEEWEKELEDTLEEYLYKNIFVENDGCKKYSKTYFIDNLKKYIGLNKYIVLKSNNKKSISFISQILNEKIGTDFIFILENKILLLHLGIE